MFLQKHVALPLLGILLVACAPEPPPKEPAPPAPSDTAGLRMNVDPPPTNVRAGEVVRLTVNYSDGDGKIMKRTNVVDGDTVVSTEAVKCDEPVAPMGPLKGSYVVTHTWDTPGTYEATLSLTTYVCLEGFAVLEEASAVVQVTVL